MQASKRDRERVERVEKESHTAGWALMHRYVVRPSPARRGTCGFTSILEPNSPGNWNMLCLAVPSSGAGLQTDLPGANGVNKGSVLPLGVIQHPPLISEGKASRHVRLMQSSE